MANWPVANYPGEPQRSPGSPDVVLNGSWGRWGGCQLEPWTGTMVAAISWGVEWAGPFQSESQEGLPAVAGPGCHSMLCKSVQICPCVSWSNKYVIFIKLSFRRFVVCVLFCSHISFGFMLQLGVLKFHSIICVWHSHKGEGDQSNFLCIKIKYAETTK